MLFSDFLYRGAHHFQKQFVNAAGIPVFPEQGVPQPVQALDYEGGFLRRICDKVFLFLHLACLLCASIIYGGEDSRKCAIFRLGLSHEAPTLLDFFGEIYLSAAKNLDFMRVCESVVMNIGTMREQGSLCSRIFIPDAKNALSMLPDDVLRVRYGFSEKSGAFHFELHHFYLFCLYFWFIPSSAAVSW